MPWGGSDLEAPDKDLVQYICGPLIEDLSGKELVRVAPKVWLTEGRNLDTFIATKPFRLIV